MTNLAHIALNGENTRFVNGVNVTTIEPRPKLANSIAAGKAMKQRVAAYARVSTDVAAILVLRCGSPIRSTGAPSGGAIRSIRVERHAKQVIFMKTG